MINYCFNSYNIINMSYIYRIKYKLGCLLFMLIVVVIVISILTVFKKYKIKEKFNNNKFENAEKYLKSDKNIEYIVKNKENIGPIIFIDSETNQELGRYPDNWNDDNIKNNNMNVTYIKIPKGPKGEKGEKGNDAEYNIENNVNLEEINSKGLKINADNLNLNANKINFNNEICFGDDNSNCLNNNIIKYIKNADLLINNNENNECDKNLNIKQLNFIIKGLTKDLNECNNNKFNLMSKTVCENEKKNINNKLNNINTDNVLNNAENKKLRGNISLNESLIAELQNTIKDNRNELDKSNKKNIKILSDAASTMTEYQRLRDDNEILKSNLLECQNNNNTVDETKYMLRSEHDNILKDYKSNNEIEKNYILKTDVDKNHTDYYGNYLTQSYVDTNYVLKEFVNDSKQCKCDNANLSNLCNNGLNFWKNKYDNDCNNNNIDITDYRHKADIANNYLLKTDVYNTIENNYIPKSDLIEGKYIKNDYTFKNNYVSKDSYNKLEEDITICENNISDKNREIDELKSKLALNKKELNNKKCTDWSVFNNINRNEINKCNSKNTLCENQKSFLKNDIKKLGSFIKDLYNNIEIKELNIKDINNSFNKEKNKYDNSIKELENKLSNNSDKINEKNETLKKYQDKISEFDEIKNNAKNIIDKLQENIKYSNNAIKELQEELSEKISKLSEASKKIEKCVEIEEENDNYLTYIGDLENKINKWELNSLGTTEIQAEINELEKLLRSARYDKQTHGINEYNKGEKKGIADTKKIYKWKNSDLTKKWQDGFEMGKNLSKNGREEEFIKEQCKAQYNAGVASKSEYIYTDEDMKNEINKAEKDIGERVCKPQAYINIT